VSSGGAAVVTTTAAEEEEEGVCGVLRVGRGATVGR